MWQRGLTLGHLCGSGVIVLEQSCGSHVAVVSYTRTAVCQLCLTLGQLCGSGDLHWDSHVAVVIFTRTAMSQW